MTSIWRCCNYIESLLGIETRNHCTSRAQSKSCNYIESLLGIETLCQASQQKLRAKVATILNPY